MADPTLSLIVITRNEAHRIGRCLTSVPQADQLVVVDSGSTDDTVALARAAGAQVVPTGDWPGFGPQKNRALGFARGSWVLSLDADEVASPELAAAIAELMAADARGERLADAWWITRSSRWCGRPVRFGDWRNDRVLRLFRRGRARFSDDIVHERLVCEGTTARLPGLLFHDSVDSPEDAREKAERYARLGAVRLRERGRGGPVSAIIHGGWSFVRGYLLRLGLLDGRAGLAIALLNARATYLRYRLAGQPADSQPPPGASP
jgi:glycosyltransferase involved in cell wall biosynthesis